MLVADSLSNAILSRLGRVLVLLAHPDDEALLCGGTIAMLASNGCSVQVVVFSDGGQGRDTVFDQACRDLGAVGRILKHNTSTMSLNGELVATTDTLIREFRPDCVITHTDSGIQNQDHVVLHRSVRLSVGRWGGSLIALATEPPLASVGFRPNVFVNIEAGFGRKEAALARYRAVLDRDYLSSDYVRTRARWWGQVSGQANGLCEAFELLVWR